jgi:predicted outer membrane repeat protein
MANSSLAMSSTSFLNNSASTAGGALAVLDGAQLSCSSGCNFSANSAALGGAIAVDAGTVNLTIAVLARNSASQELVSVTLGNTQQRAGSGGAIFAANSTVALSKCSLQDNSAEAQGGALLLMSSAATLVGSRFTGNKAAAGASAPAAAAQQMNTAGGAILVGLLPAALGAGSKGSKQVQAMVKLQDSVLSGNAAGYGGALAAMDAATDMQGAAGGPAPRGSALSIQLVGSSLVDNTASVSGGAVFSNLQSAALTLSGSKVTSNTATQGGGGIAAVTPAAVQMASSTVSGNSAAHCAGMLLDTPAQDSFVRSSRFEGNMAGQQVEDASSFGQLPQWNSTGSGGGMCIIPGAAVSVTASTITQNSALHGGEKQRNAGTTGGVLTSCTPHLQEHKQHCASILDAAPDC